MNMMKDKMNRSLLIFPLTLLLSSVLAISCGSDDDDNSSSAPQQEQETVVGPLGAGATQVERLARPAINEGLIISNEFLNAFNSIPPSADLSDAAAPVREEAALVIDAADMIDGKDDLPTSAVTNAFLPDVMRIDTRLDIAPGKTAYNADVSGDLGMLTGGRKIEDDVIDITLSFLVSADATGDKVKDNVFYEGVPGNPAQPGHKKLYQQKNRKGPASFPFLAEPN